MTNVAGSVVVVDPHRLVRETLAKVVDVAGHAVVGLGAGTDDGVRLTTALKPDVCVLSGQSPATVAALRRIADDAPRCRVVVLAASPTPDFVVAALRAGAAGVLPASVSRRGFVRSIAAVLSGEIAIPRSDLETLLRDWRGGQRRTSLDGSLLSLTSRESEVFAFIEQGSTTAAIAAELGLSEITVRRHISGIAAKAGAAGRSAIERMLGAA